MRPHSGHLAQVLLFVSAIDEPLVSPLMEDRVQSVKRTFDEGSSTESTKHPRTMSLEQELWASSSPSETSTNRGTFPPDEIKNHDDNNLQHLISELEEVPSVCQAPERHLHRTEVAHHFRSTL